MRMRRSKPCLCQRRVAAGRPSSEKTSASEQWWRHLLDLAAWARLIGGMSCTIGTPLSATATKVLLLGSGELGKEVAIELQRLGVEVIAADRYANAPAMQVAHRSHVLSMLDGAALRRVIELEKPDLVVPEIEAIATDTLLELEAEGFHIVPTARATRLTMNREGIRRLAAEELALPCWSIAWQSAGATPEPWRGPDILDLLRDRAADDATDAVLVCPQGFVADHLEVAYDLDIEAARLAAEVGIGFARTRVLNVDEAVLGALAERIVATATEAAP